MRRPRVRLSTIARALGRTTVSTRRLLHRHGLTQKYAVRTVRLDLPLVAVLLADRLAQNLKAA